MNKQQFLNSYKMENHTIDFQKAFGNNLKALRESRNWKQKDIAELLKIPQSTYANWEQGRRNPAVEDYYNLMRVFDVDANELFDIIK